MNDELMSRLYDESKVYRDTEWGEKVQFFDHRKFAMLIIQECISVIDNETKTDWDTRLKVCDELKEHFGVK